MNKLILATTTALALGLSTFASAQPATADAGARMDRSERAEQHMARHLDRMASELNLTQAQKLELEAVMRAQHAERMALRQRHMEESRALREQGKAQVDAILSAEQKAQLEAHRAERRAAWEARRGEDRRGHGKRHGRHHGE